MEFYKSVGAINLSRLWARESGILMIALLIMLALMVRLGEL